MDEHKKMRIDEDWKTQAEEEKRKLEAAAAARGARGAPQRPGAPTASTTPPPNGGHTAAPAHAPAPPPAAAPAPAPPSPAAPPAAQRAVDESAHADEARSLFLFLVEQLGAQALSGLGHMPDPRTGQAGIDLEFARDSIEMITMLEQKTRGNLTDLEQRTLAEILHSLRLAFSATSREVARREMQQMQQIQAGMHPGAAPGGRPEKPRP